jgi:hypothetical protein
MKKVFLLLLALIYGESTFASGYTVANNWRWKADVGSITNNNNWIAPVSTTPVVSTPGPIRLRVSTITEADYEAANGDNIVLQYRVEPQSSINSTISPTAGTWKDVVVGDSSSTTEPFVINPNYTGPLVNKSVSAIGQITNATGSSGRQAFHENIANGDGDSPFQQAIALSKTNSYQPGSIGDDVNEGGYEVEYRLVFTKNAVPGQVYYFRQINKRTTGGAGIGTTDSWDYAAGFPNIVVSPNYNGITDTKLPDIRAQILTGTGAFTTGLARSGSFRISNVGSVPSIGTIKATINIPTGWAFSIPTPPTGWSYSAGSLTTSTVVLAAGGVQNFNFTMINNTGGFAASFLQVVIDKTVTVDGDGSNNLAVGSVYKQL